MTTVAVYNFNNALEGAVVYDDTGIHNGSVVGTVPLVDGPISQKSRYFNGDAANYLTVPHQADLQIDTDWTIEAWVDFLSISTGQRPFLSKGRWGISPIVLMGALNEGSYGKPYCYIGTDASNYLLLNLPSVVLYNSRLYYWALTFNRFTKKMLLYIDGCCVGTNTEVGTYTGGDAGSYAVLMGTLHSSTAAHYGNIHGIRWSDTIKTSKEIYDTYTATNVQERV